MVQMFLLCTKYGPKKIYLQIFLKKELTPVDWLMIMSGSSGGSLVVSLNFFLVDFFMFMDENKGFFFFQFCGFKILVITFIVLKF
jgi:hypothetical protein